ncbi:integrator complex subunit 12-like isoform X2 [Thrips palmi]|uniref:Integrator complex subunit 12-like isoform X2 n=1 Tax=Thrips palmi TaxID=161013 RepID=A0A6P8YND0_THRPL|nr:integrator complex subunit 12-like isoform X2 [Thrips palmi]
MAAFDPILARGVKLMLSNEPDAAEQLRAMLEEALRNKYGANIKLPSLSEVEESAERKLYDSASSSKVHSPSPLTALSDESSGSASADIDDSFCMNFTELSCVVCGQFNVGARNQLMECNSCQKLYHQDCHVPPVQELASSSWDCGDCAKKKQPKVKTESPVSGGKPVSFASLTSGSSSSHKSSSKSSSSSSSSSSHKSSSKSSSSHSHSSSNKRHSSSSSSSHKSSSHHKSSSSRHSK